MSSTPARCRSASIQVRRMLRPGAIGAILALSACIGAAGAAAQTADVYDLSRQVSELRRDFSRLQQQMYSAQPPAAGRTGGPIDLSPAYRERVEVRLNDMEGQLRDLTGRVEEVSFSLQRFEDRLEKLVADVDFRLAALERSTSPGAAMPPAEIPSAQRGEGAAGDRPADPDPVREPTGTANLLPAGSAAEQYQEAQRLLTQGRYEDAEAALRTFLDRHPENQLSDNARYWLGESYYVRKRYEEAASAFLDNYKRGENGSKAPDNLLKLGLSLSALNKEKEACVAINKLLREYPDSPDHIRRRAEQEKRALSCT